jgi:hypothetical protein
MHFDTPQTSSTQATITIHPMSSELSPPESRGPTKVVDAGATCSLPVVEAEALAQEWLTRSLKCNQRNIEARRAGDDDLALANSVRSATYLLCADELRQRAGIPIQRQPEENVVHEPQARQKTL